MRISLLIIFAGVEIGNIEIILETNLKWEISLITSVILIDHTTIIQLPQGHSEACLSLIMIKTINDYKNKHDPCVACDMAIATISLYFLFVGWNP